MWSQGADIVSLQDSTSWPNNSAVEVYLSGFSERLALEK